MPPPSSYDVELITTDQYGCPDTTTQTITLLPRPQPDFDATVNCVGQPVDFTNTSTISSGTLDDYLWKFLPIGTEESNPNYPTFQQTFASSLDTISVRLIATSDQGCIDSVTVDVPLRFISASVAASCGGDTLWAYGQIHLPQGQVANFGWNAGDGTNYPNQDTLQHVYSTSGAYTAYFYFEQTSGCTDTLFFPVQAVIIDTELNGDTLCFGAAAFPVSFSGYGLQDIRWDFCSPDFSEQPLAVSVFTDTANQLSTAGEYHTPIIADGMRYMFLTNRQNLARLDFGTSFGNLPSIDFLGNPSGLVGDGFGNLELVQDGANWFGFRMDYNDGRVVRYAFGTSLENTPTANEIVIPSGSGYQPGNIDIVQENGNTKLLIANRKDSSFTLVTFTGPLSAAPAAIQRIPIPNGFGSLVVRLRKAACGQWVGTALAGTGVMALNTTNEVYALSFPDTLGGGNPTFSLLDTLPQATNFMSTFEGKGHYFTVVNGLSNNEIYLIDTPEDPMSGPPTVQTHTGISSPHGYTLVEDSGSVYGFGTNRSSASNPFVRRIFESACGTGSAQTGVSPSYIYADTGTYLFSFSGTITSTGQHVELLDTLYVRPGVVADFSVPTACQGQTVPFSFTGSVPAGGSIVQTAWDFGDSNSSSLLNPEHVYNTAGNVNVQLVAVDNNGCTDTLVEIVSVNPTPVALYDVQAVCADEDPMFTNLSSVALPDTIAFSQWTFAGGATVLVNPGDSFSVPSQALGGSDSLELVVVSSVGCADTLADVLDIPTLNIGQDVFCANQAILFQALYSYPSDAPTDFFWDFGPAGTQNSQIPTPVSFNAGNYTVSLVVTTQGGCVDTVQRSLELVTPPVLSLLPSDTICRDQSLVIQDVTTVGLTPVLSREWVATPQGQLPIVVNGTTIGLVPDTTLPINVTYTLTLQGGCVVDTAFSVIPQAPPVVTLPNDTFTVCLGTPIQLSYTSLGTPVVGQRWELDTLGGTVFNSQPSPTFAFPLPTVKDIRLTVRSAQNCVARDTVRVVVLPMPDAAITTTLPIEGNAPLTVSAQNISTGPADYYVWWVGNSSLTPTAAPAAFDSVFTTEGDYWLRLEAVADQCTSSDSILLRVLPPIPTIWDVSIQSVAVLTEGEYIVRLLPTFRNDGTQPIYSLGYHINFAPGLELYDSLQGLNLLPGQQLTMQVGPNVQQNPHEPHTYACVALSLPAGLTDPTPWNNDSCTSLTGSLELLNLYPNPVVDGSTASVQFVAEVGATAHIRVLDASGREVLTLPDYTVQVGPNTVALPVGSLTGGTYTVEVRVGSDREFAVLIRQ